MERRAEPRFSVTSSVRLTRLSDLNRAVDVKLLDVSATGLRLLTTEDLAQDELVGLELEGHLVVCRVRNSQRRGDKFAVGVQRIHSAHKDSLPADRSKHEQMQALLADRGLRLTTDAAQLDVVEEPPLTQGGAEPDRPPEIAEADDSASLGKLCLIDRSPTGMAAPESIEDLLAGFTGSDFERFRPFFRRLLDAAPEKGTRAIMRHLAERDLGPAERFMISCLSTGGDCFSVLFDTKFFSLAQARRIAAHMIECDPLFLFNVEQAVGLGNIKDRSSLARALDVLSIVEDPGRLVPLLFGLTHHPDSRIRSKAVMSLCRSRPSPTIIEKYLESEDPRIRASALEAIWYASGTETANVFRASLLHNHHRVVANALLGLHYCGDDLAFERTVRLAKHQAPAFRAAMAWVLGQMGDTRAIPALITLTKDPAPDVRRNADRALLSLRRKSPPLGRSTVEATPNPG